MNFKHHVVNLTTDLFDKVFAYLVINKWINSFTHWDN